MISYKTMISYKSTKLFPIKDKTDYYGKGSNEGCKDNYVGETKRRIVERIENSNSKDSSSHLLKHTHKNGNIHVWEKNFQILGKNYQSNLKRKISESLLVRQKTYVQCK